MVRAVGAPLAVEVAPEEGSEALTYTHPRSNFQQVSLGFTWSSVSAWQRGKARFPIELEWTRTIAVAGDGDAPRFTTDRLSVRAYARLWGR